MNTTRSTGGIVFLVSSFLLPPETALLLTGPLNINSINCFNCFLKRRLTNHWQSVLIPGFDDDGINGLASTRMGSIPDQLINNFHKQATFYKRPLALHSYKRMFSDFFFFGNTEDDML